MLRSMLMQALCTLQGVCSSHKRGSFLGLEHKPPEDRRLVHYIPTAFILALRSLLSNSIWRQLCNMNQPYTNPNFLYLECLLLAESVNSHLIPLAATGEKKGEKKVPGSNCFGGFHGITSRASNFRYLNLTNAGPSVTQPFCDPALAS